MTDEYHYPLGFYRGEKFHMTVRLDPDANNVHDFAVIVRYTDSNDQNHQIVRIDNAHGTTHIDQLYRDPVTKKPINLAPHEAEAYLKENWQKYARRYDRTHGL